jgi:hypothetical protein
MSTSFADPTTQSDLSDLLRRRVVGTAQPQSAIDDEGLDDYSSTPTQPPTNTPVRTRMPLSYTGNPAGDGTSVQLPYFSGGPNSGSQEQIGSLQGANGQLDPYGAPYAQQRSANVAHVAHDFAGLPSDDPATSRYIDMANHPDQYGGDPAKPAWWRTILAGVASAVPIARNFAPQIAYGWQGAHDINQYQQQLQRVGSAAQLSQHEQQLQLQEQEKMAQIEANNQYRQGLLGNRAALEADTQSRNAWAARNAAEGRAGANAEPVPASQTVAPLPSLVQQPSTPVGGPPRFTPPNQPPNLPAPGGPSPQDQQIGQQLAAPSLVAPGGQLLPNAGWRTTPIPAAPSAPATTLQSPPLEARGTAPIPVPSEFQSILGPTALPKDIVDVWKAKQQQEGKNIGLPEMYLRANNGDPAAAIRAQRQDEMKLKMLDPANQGTWQIAEDATGKPVLFNTKTSETRPANGVQRSGTEAKVDAAQQKNTEPAQAALGYAQDYIKNGIFTGPGDEALQEKFFELAKPATGFRMTQPQMNMLAQSRSWMGGAEAHLRHATTGTWFSPEQRQQIVNTMNELAQAKLRANAPIGGGGAKGGDPLGIR